MSMKRYFQAKRKLAEIRAQKPIQHLFGGGDVLGGLMSGGGLLNSGTDPSGMTGGWAGTQMGGGAMGARNGITDWMAGRDPGRSIGNAFNPQITSLPNLAHAPTGIANPFDMGNPTVQAMHQQTISPDFGGSDNINGNQVQLMQALQKQALGQGGPGQQLAQSMLNQQTQQNIAQNAGMIASTKGINPVIAARLAGQNAGTMNQQAAMQGTQLGLQNQLNAQQQLGGLMSGMRQQDLDQALGGAGVQLQNQGQQLGALGQYNQQQVQGQLGSQGQNVDIAKAQMQARQGMFGGLLGAGGGILASVLGGGGGAAAGGAGGAGGYAGGDAGEAAGEFAGMAAHGALIPGKAKVAGDNEKNDVVDARLSPGEIVIPRSITQHEHAPYLAAEFVRKVLAGNGPKPKFKKADGGEVADDEAIPDAAFQSSGPQDSQIADWLTMGGGPGGNQSLVGTAMDQIPDKLGTLGQTISQGGRRYRGEDGTNIGAGDDTQMPETASPNTNLKYNPNTMGIPTDAKAQGQDGPDPWANILSAQNKALDQMEAGAKGLGAAGQAEAASQGKAYDQYVQNTQQAQDRYQQGLKQLDTENQQLTQSIMSGKIDPNRIWSSASTGNKVMAAIGIMLSGIGSGLTGQPNMAMGVINKMIDQDIDAQKADLGKKQTLLSANLAKYGRMDAAYHATQAQMHAVVEGQLGKAAATGGGMRSAANAQAALGQLGIQRAGLQQQAAVYGAASGQPVPGQGINLNRLRLGVQAGLIPKEAGNQAMKEAGEYIMLQKQLEATNKAFDDVRRDQEAANRFGKPLQSKSQIDAASKLYGEMIARDASGRVSDAALQGALANFPTYTDNKETISKKRANVTNLLKSKAGAGFPTLQAYGLVSPNDPYLQLSGTSLPGEQATGPD